MSNIQTIDQIILPDTWWRSKSISDLYIHVIGVRENKFAPPEELVSVHQMWSSYLTNKFHVEPKMDMSPLVFANYVQIEDEELIALLTLVIQPTIKTKEF